MNKLLEWAGLHIAREEAELILAHLIKKDLAWMLTHNEEEISPADEDAFKNFVNKRKNHIPVAYILGEWDFYGQTFFVTENTLVPRPETELLIDFLKEDFNADEPITIADIGTGSGILAVTASLLFPKANVYGTDISEEALKVATKNKKSKKATNLMLHQSDLLEYFLSNKITCDAVLANLPYLSQVDINQSPTKEDLLHEPSQALLAQENGLALMKKAVLQSRHVLKKNGKMYLEMLPRQIDEFTDWVKSENLPFHVILKKDLNNIKRFIILTYD